MHVAGMIPIHTQTSGAACHREALVVECDNWRLSRQLTMAVAVLTLLMLTSAPTPLAVSGQHTSGVFGQHNFNHRAPAAAAPAAATPPAPQLRSVLLITVDDLRPQLGAYGITHTLTPNIDRLAEEGTTFLRA
jgi:hypothetical protein